MSKAISYDDIEWRDERIASLESRLDEAATSIDALKAQLAEHQQIYTRTDNDVAIVNALLDGSREANETLKAQLAKAEAHLARAGAEISILTQGVFAAEATSARLKEILAKVEAWMANDGAVHQLWEDCDIGDYEDEHGGPMDWPTTLESVRDLSVPIEYLGVPIGSKPPAVLILYREILAALDGGKETSE